MSQSIHPDTEPPREVKSSFIWDVFVPSALCAVFAMLAGLCGLTAMLIQMLVNMNLNFGSTAHLTIFVIGWLTVLTCFYASYRMIRHASYRSLWFGIPAGSLVALDLWLYSLPSAKGLFH